MFLSNNLIIKTSIYTFFIFLGDNIIEDILEKNLILGRGRQIKNRLKLNMEGALKKNFEYLSKPRFLGLEKFIFSSCKYV